MNEAGQTICLCMIVRNEAHVLRRCLQSVRSLIDCWLIVDTGSTDGTQALVRESLRDLPGQLEERPWIDFGHNRTESIALARGRGDYLLTLDADEYLQAEAEFRWPKLTSDAYDFVMSSGGVTYTRLQLLCSELPWRYEGVLHEYLTCDQRHSQARMPGVKTVRMLEGARARDPETYHRDAQLLENVLLQEPDNARCVFYLAQSYRDAQRPRSAMKYYKQRSRMGGFSEELWCSLYQLAVLMQQTGVAWPAVKEAYLDAYRYRPWRAESLYRIGSYLENRGAYAEAFPFLEQAMQIPLPSEEVLFVESDVYLFALPFLYSAVCYRLGKYRAAIVVVDRLLAGSALSTDRREHLLRLRQVSIEALSSVSASFGAKE